MPHRLRIGRAATAIAVAGTFLVGCMREAASASSTRVATHDVVDSLRWPTVPESLLLDVVDHRRWATTSTARCPIAAALHPDGRHFAVSDCMSRGLLLGETRAGDTHLRVIDLAVGIGGPADRITALSWDASTGAVRGYAQVRGRLVFAGSHDSVLTLGDSVPRVGVALPEWASRSNSALVGLYPAKTTMRDADSKSPSITHVIRSGPDRLFDTLASLVSPKALASESGGQVNIFLPPYRSSTLWLFENGAIAFLVRTDSGRVTPIALNLSALDAWPQAVAGPVMTDHEREETINAAPAAFRKQVRDEMPARWPALRGAIADGDQVWLAVRSAYGSSLVSWRGYSRDGALTGAFHVADSLEVLAIHNPWILVARREDASSALSILELVPRALEVRRTVPPFLAPKRSRSNREARVPSYHVIAP